MGDAVNAPLGYTKGSCYFRPAFTFVEAVFYFNNIFGCQFPCPWRHRGKPCVDRVFLVLLWCAVLKIDKPIVGLIPVDVVNPRAFWSRSLKSKKDQRVNGFLLALAKGRGPVSLWMLAWLQRATFYPALVSRAANGFADKPREAPHGSKVADFVAKVPWDGLE